jgi:uncharacterized protein (TIGR03437 family)
MTPHTNTNTSAAGTGRQRRRSSISILFWSGILAMGSAQVAISQTYTITTAAGNGTIGNTGDGGPGPGAALSAPTGVTVDGAGNLYIADTGNYRVRKVSTNGTISNFAGTGAPGFSGDGGPATAAKLGLLFSVAVDNAGNVYIAGQDSLIRKVSAAGVISTVAGSSGASLGDGGPATQAELNQPRGITVDAAGNLYIADTGFNRIRKVTASGIITTVAGNGRSDYSGDGGPATSAALNTPSGVAVDAAGNIYIADTSNARIRKVTPAGIITTVVGTGAFGYSGDGSPAVNATIRTPMGVAIDASGSLYISDWGSGAIRKVTGGIISTIAGGGKSYPGDYGPAINASISQPAGIAVDGGGNVYFAEEAADRIRALKPVAGPGGALPSIKSGGVISASAFGGFPAITPSGWSEIYGSNLATGMRSWAATDFHGLTAPNVLDGTSVSIGGHAAYLSYISPTQINAQVPSNIGTGTQPIVVTSPAGNSAVYMVAVNAVEPGLLAPSAFNVGGKQYVGAISSDGKAFILPDGAVPGVPARMAKPGDTIILFGVGFGPVTPGIDAGEIVVTQNSLASNFEVLIGGAVANLTYYGLAPNQVGLYQFNVTIPNIPGGAAVPITFLVNGAQSQQTLWIALSN